MRPKQGPNRRATGVGMLRPGSAAGGRRGRRREANPAPSQPHVLLSNIAARPLPQQTSTTSSIGQSTTLAARMEQTAALHEGRRLSFSHVPSLLDGARCASDSCHSLAPTRLSPTYIPVPLACHRLRCSSELPKRPSSSPERCGPPLLSLHVSHRGPPMQRLSQG